MKRPQRVNRPLTPAEQTKIERARRETEREKDRIVARLNKLSDRYERRMVALRTTLSLLKEVRQAKGVTLPELSVKTGIGKGALSRLENDPNPNPTLRFMASATRPSPRSGLSLRFRRASGEKVAGQAG
jgi:hypothetical protein